MNIKTISIIAACILGGLGVYVWSNQETTEIAETVSQPTRVEAARVGDLGSLGDRVHAYGQVVSVTGLDVVPEIAGVVSRVNKKLGAVVRAGDVVVELENSAQRQGVAQAQAALDQSQAALARLERGADDSDLAQADAAVIAAEQGLAQTEQTILTTLDTLYASLLTTLNQSIDTEFFTNTNSTVPDTKIEFESSVELSLGIERKEVENVLLSGRDYADSEAAIAVFTERVSLLRSLNSNIRSAASGLEADESLSRATIQDLLQTLDSVQDTLAEYDAQATTLAASYGQAQQNVLSTRLQAVDVKDGADQEDILQARAAVSQARAGLLSAEIALAKTQITAPVFGTVSAIDIRRGGLVGPGAAIFSVANEQALRIDTNLAPAEATQLRVGGSVLIDKTIPATISVISPSINKQTGRVSVQVIPNQQQAGLVSGQGVQLVFTAAVSAETNTVELPIEAVFVRGSTNYVYLLQDNKAVPQVITTDNLFGDRISISSGLAVQDTVILNARGLKDMQEVLVISNTQ